MYHRGLPRSSNPDLSNRAGEGPLNHPEAIVVGGGFYGAALAVELAASRRVLLIEQADQLLSRASYANQARVHFGYHYPRSFLTAVRSRINAPRFIADYGDCVVEDFVHYYGIARAFSKVTAAQFRTFCQRIGAPVEPAPASVRRWFNPVLIEDVVTVREPAFDAAKLRVRLGHDLAAAGVSIRLGTEAVSVAAASGGGLAVTIRSHQQTEVLATNQVLNCTYARTNGLLANSRLPLIPLKHEIAEMLLIEPPAELRQAAVTVMCGPFFSSMPFPALGNHTLSHVRYTPHRAWLEGPDHRYVDPYQVLAAESRRSHGPAMLRDAARYLPMMATARHYDSIWEIKTVLPRSETDDSRPILFRTDHGLPGLHCIAGAKLDNVYDMLESPLLAKTAVGSPP